MSQPHSEDLVRSGFEPCSSDSRLSCPPPHLLPSPWELSLVWHDARQLNFKSSPLFLNMFYFKNHIKITQPSAGPTEPSDALEALPAASPGTQT